VTAGDPSAMPYSRPMALAIVLVTAMVLGYVGLFALWWFGFRGRGPDH